MKYIFSIALMLATTVGGFAQETKTEWQDPATPSFGAMKPRSEFFSYNIRSEAQAGDRTKAMYYMPLEMRGPVSEGATNFYINQAEIPFKWLNRDLFLHVEGAQAFYLYINGKMVGFGSDSKSYTEFYISDFVTDGTNTIRIESMTGSAAGVLEASLSDAKKTSGGLGQIYIYSQPKVRIADYTIRCVPDSLGKYGRLNLDVAISNSYNSTENVTIGYDIYSPAGKLLYYDMRDSRLVGHGVDTVRFRETIYGAMQNLWSAQTPALYKVMIFVKKDGQLVEYIPLKVGFGTTTFRGGEIVRNGKTVAISAARYNAESTVTTTRQTLQTLKSQGINTICVDYPQHYWFYELCTSVGLYVIDQANINNSITSADRTLGGSPSNDPRWVSAYTHRAESMYGHSHNHPCIIGWSTGGHSGNGYNMYRGYQRLKGLDRERAVLYIDAAGEWNSDVPYPTTSEKR